MNPKETKESKKLVYRVVYKPSGQGYVYLCVWNPSLPKVNKLYKEALKKLGTLGGAIYIEQKEEGEEDADYDD